MNGKVLLKSIVENSKLLSFLYQKIYIRFLEWRRFNVSIADYGDGNIVEIPKNTFCSDLKITFRGSNNKIRIGDKCCFYQTNSIYFQGEGNTVDIADDVIFDQNVSIVVAEGTKVSIGSGCRFANGVKIRTSDQHFIFDSEGTRINYARDVKIGNHVWLGALVIVMKGAIIGDDSVVGMDSMVTKEIPSRSLAVGKPAKIIRNDIVWKE